MLKWKYNSNNVKQRENGNLDEILDLDKTLGDYKLQELSLVAKGNRTVTGLLSSADIINVKSSKHRQNSVCDSSLSSGSFGSRSVSPVPVVNMSAVPPQPPVRKKRRPAPKPPISAENEKKEEKTTTRSVLISHSRESSDSSGYHEASVLSESPTNGSSVGRRGSSTPPDTLPRLSKLPPSQSFTNLTSIQPVPRSRLVNSVSNTSLSSNGPARKKRVAPPPPAQAKQEEKMKASTLPTEKRHMYIDEESENSYNRPTSLTYPVEKSAETKVEKVEKPVEAEPVEVVVEETKAIVSPPKVEQTPGKDAPSEDLSPAEDPEQTEPDSLNWEYQLPPPPTDFRDAHSPDCTEFGTVTLAPDIYQEEKKEEIIVKEELKEEPHVILRRPEKPKQDENVNSKVLNEVRLSQNKADVMSELTNVLNENRKFKEKSLSVTNLYMDDVKKKNALNYSRSFSIEPSFTLKNFKITTYETNGVEYNRRLSNEKLYDNEVSYRNNKNLEKSSSMECIKIKENENRSFLSEKNNEDCFRKPIAPVQKKMKAKRSASSVGIRRNSNSSETDENEEMLPEAVLRQQFLEFLKEKKIMSNDLNPKSLEVLKNILPQLDSQIIDHNNSSQDKIKKLDQVKEVIDDKVKIVEIKMKEEAKEKETEAEPVLDREKPEVPVQKTEVPMQRTEPVEKPEVPVQKPEPLAPKPEVPVQRPEIPVNRPEVKRYSYQGPPSINFGTWGERPVPRTKIIIKDEDYITQDKLPEKKAEEKKFQGVNTSVPNYRELLKKPPPPPTFKKPSNYEIFSALPKKKDVSSIELIRLEEEEKKRNNNDPSRVPIVCGVELKKEFKKEEAKPLKHSVSESSIKPEVRPKLSHSVSVYVNGNHENFTNKNTTKTTYNFVQPKRTSLMPVVKGFRTVEEIPSQSHVNNFSNNKNNATNESSAINNQKSTSGGIPPPPPVGLINLKPVASRQLKQKPANSEDTRGALLEEIRNFGGLKKLKTVQ